MNSAEMRLGVAMEPARFARFNETRRKTGETDLRQDKERGEGTTY
jgi:hypothetical protein